MLSVYVDRQFLEFIGRNVNSVVFETFHAIFHSTLVPLDLLAAFDPFVNGGIAAFSMSLRDSSSGCSLFLKCSVQVFHDFMVNVSLVRTESSSEAFRNV